MRIRQATLADADTLSALSAEAFVQAFGPMYPPKDLQDFIATAYAPAKQAQAIGGEGCAVFLLEDDAGRAVGYAAVGPCGLPHDELTRLFLLRHVLNGGWGGGLFDDAIDRLLRDGPRRIWIGVYSENYGAQRFYERRGWEKVGQYHYAVGTARDLEWILRKDPS